MMSRLFMLRHLDGAPLLTPGKPEDEVRYLGESVRLLDAEPVIVINLDHLPFDDAVNACREMLFAKDPDRAIIVIDPSHTMNIPPRHDGRTGVKVVDSIAAAAVDAFRIQHGHRRRAEGEPPRRRRFHVRRTIG